MPSARDMFSIVPLMVITRSILKLLTSFKLDVKRFLDQLLLSKKKKTRLFHLPGHGDFGFRFQHNPLDGAASFADYPPDQIVVRQDFQ